MNTFSQLGMQQAPPFDATPIDMISVPQDAPQGYGVGQQLPSYPAHMPVGAPPMGPPGGNLLMEGPNVAPPQMIPSGATMLPPDIPTVHDLSFDPQLVSGSEIGERKNPILKVPFTGIELDLDSLVVLGLVIAGWVLIWYASGLYKTLGYDYTFTAIFYGLIAYMLISIYNSDTTSGGVVYELNVLLTVEQMISILFGSMILFLLFASRLDYVHETCVPIIFKLNISIVTILAVASLWVNVVTNGRMFRATRKLKQGVYNVALTLFIIICLIIYKGRKCGV